MVHLRSVIVSVGCLLAAQAAATAQDPVNPNASQKTRDVLKLLYELPNRPDRRVMSGQVLKIMTSGPTPTNPDAPIVYNPNPYSHIQDIHDKYGVWVAIAGAEYTDWWYKTGGVLINNQTQGKILWRQINPALIQHSRNGGIAELHFHPMSPRNGAGGDGEEQGLTADDLLNPGWIHDNWIRYLDETATGLRELRDNDVVVIWRPWHGRDSGNGWWWSEFAMAQSDFNKIWEHMFNYFTYTWGLNNLLWNQDWYVGGRWSGGDIGHLYVGNNLVDIVSVDTTAGDIWPSEYDNLLAFGKPIAIGQDGAMSADPTYVDNVAPQITNIRANVPRITYHIQFEKDGWSGMWNSHWDIASSDGASQMLNDSWTLNAPIFSGPPPSGQPDVVVTALSYSNGTFTCTVVNQGDAATPDGVTVGVGYFVDGAQVTWGSIHYSLAPGASAEIGTTGGNYTIPDGTHTIMAYVDDVNRFTESNEGNNQLARTITVGGSPPPPQGDGTGFTAQYFNGANFETLVSTQIDPQVDFGWSTPEPSEFSVIWTGFLDPTFSEVFTFTTLTDDGVRLWVNGQRLIDHWEDHNSAWDSGSIELTAGQRVEIRMEYYKNGYAGQARLYWSSASQPMELIPASRVFAAKAASLASSPAPRRTGSGGKTGSCGLTGLETILLMGVLSMRRRSAR